MRICDIIVESYSDALAEFSRVADPAVVQATIDQYRKLLNRNQLASNERNIDDWRKHGWDKFLERVQELSLTNTKTAIKRKKIKGNSITIYEDNKWLVVVPLDKDASCFHGKDTDWCTTKLFQRNFEDYFYKRSVTLIYAISKDNAGHYAIAVETSKPTEYFDQKDKSIDANQFQQATKLDPEHLIKLAHSNENNPQLDRSRTSFKEAMIKIQFLLDMSPLDHKKLVPLLTFTKDPTLCTKYIIDYSKEVGKPVIVPDTILINAASSILMISEPNKELVDAIDFSKVSIPVIRTLCKFHPEIVIIKHNELTPSQFQIITEYPTSSVLYAVNVMKGPWLPGEPSILTSASASYTYVMNAINDFSRSDTQRRKRWLPGEAIIATTPTTANFYACFVLKRRWSNESGAEDVILTDAYCAADYAINVIKDEWPEAESIIKTDPEALELYSDFLKSKDQDSEDTDWY